MIKIWSKDNNLRTEEGTVTRSGYFALFISTIFGLGIFLLGRYLYGRTIQKECASE